VFELVDRSNAKSFISRDRSVLLFVESAIRFHAMLI